MSPQEYTKQTEATMAWFKQEVEKIRKTEAPQNVEKKMVQLQEEMNVKLATLQKQLASSQQTTPPPPPSGQVTNYSIEANGSLSLNSSFRTSPLSSDELKKFMETPEKSSFDIWMLAAEALFKNGSRQQAVFAGHVAKFLAVAAQKNVPLDGYMIGMNSRVAPAFVWVGADLELYVDLFNQAAAFTAKTTWQNSPTGMSAEDWNGKIKKVVADEKKLMHSQPAPEQKRQFEKVRQANGLPGKKDVTAERGPALPFNWR